jgi:L-alanine-DL-glutamate epimerase-like enolase superfamily enzyme
MHMISDSTINQQTVLSVDVVTLETPLEHPYATAYGRLLRLTSVWVRVVLDTGHEGWGESTPLVGYNDNDAIEIARYSEKLAHQSVGLTIEEVIRNTIFPKDGFLFSAYLTALESCCLVYPETEGVVPLIGLAEERAEETPSQCLERLRQIGYQTFKIKVGCAHLDEDLRRLQSFQNALLQREHLRVDANQALNASETKSLVEVCDPSLIQFLEQPMRVGCEEEMIEICQSHGVRLLLDESVKDTNAINFLSKSGFIGGVKLKWMKLGTYERLVKTIQSAKQKGYSVILGNGVATSLNNRHESFCWLAQLNQDGLAGEMNGFLKTPEIFRAGWGLSFKNGAVTLSNKEVGVEDNFLSSSIILRHKVFSV